MALSVVPKLIAEVLKEAEEEGHNTTDDTKFASMVLCVPTEQVAESLKESTTFATFFALSHSCLLHIKTLERVSDVTRIFVPTEKTRDQLNDLATEDTPFTKLFGTLQERLEGKDKQMKAFKSGRADKVVVKFGKVSFTLTKEGVTPKLVCTNKKKLFATEGDIAVVYA